MKQNDTGKFDFLSKTALFFGVSTVLVIASIAIIAMKGFNYGIDFSGGTEIQVQFTDGVTTGDLRAVTSELGFKKAIVQSFGENNEFLVRLNTVQGKNEKQTNEILNKRIATITNGLKS